MADFSYLLSVSSLIYLDHSLIIFYHNIFYKLVLVRFFCRHSNTQEKIKRRKKKTRSLHNSITKLGRVWTDNNGFRFQ